MIYMNMQSSSWVNNMTYICNILADEMLLVLCPILSHWTLWVCNISECDVVSETGQFHMMSCGLKVLNSQ